ncbi:hypothetical protein BU17DRAFT_37710 [Hysterangium stoloniferum]|nr:hypothetical protein BU17DRAFT_37710 [Hysterangium stoloniferum]
MGSFVRWQLGIRTWINHQVVASKTKKSFYHTPIAANTVTPPAAYSPPLSAHDAKEIANHRRLDQLSALLASDRPNSSRVWEIYCTLGNSMGFDQVPLDVHRRALRKAVPLLDRLLVTNSKRVQSEHSLLVPHLYEKRLQIIIGNIRESGHLPDLSDYHFVVEQFAAVGYYQGAMAVFREVVHHIGMAPTHKTYGLCLKALVHRLDLPCPYRFRRELYADATRTCFELMDDMWERRVSFTSVNFDLFHRVFKCTENFAFYERLLRIAYGVDLSFPDRLPLEFQGDGILTDSGEVAGGFKPLPFSTAALNTLVDLLGKRKLIPKMVTAFEVLTAPLPKPISAPSSSPSQEDDEDDPAFFKFSPPGSVTDLAYPSCTPNTSTFIFMIRHAANAKRAAFARHYFLQAQEIYRREIERLREELFTTPLEDIAAPAINVNRGMFLSIHGYANHEKKRHVITWLYRQTRQTIHHKRLDLDFFIRWRERFLEASRPLEATSGDNGMIGLSSNVQSTSTTPNPTLGNPLPAATYFSSNHSLENPDILKVDLDAPPLTCITYPKKPYSIDIHIQVLQRDIEELDSLLQRMQLAHTRIDVRLMERFGRRVWRKRDIYIPSEGGRVHVDRRVFLSMVRFGNRPFKATIRVDPPWMNAAAEKDSQEAP